MVENQSVVEAWSKASARERADIIKANMPETPLVGLFLLGALTLPAIIHRIEQAWTGAKEGHHRKALLEAYRRRHQWRRADLRRLQQLDIGHVAAKPLERITTAKLPGRGVVREYEPLDKSLINKVADLYALFDASTSSKDRIQLLQKTAIFPSIIEALYRGEYNAAKAARMTSASEYAALSVAKYFGFSEAKVRKLCTKARVKQADYADDALLPAMQLSHFDVWTQRGGDLWDD
jgi:hypothetical protein